VAEPRNYHGEPVIQEPTWTWEIPLYFYTGGMAGASAGLAWLADLRGNETLAERAWAVSLGAVGVSPVLLISDLGRPARFLNMLRMFKVTSPMSVGSWVLSGSGTTTGFAALYAWTGLFPRLGRAARPLAALLGLPLSTYTAALVANTAVPVWHNARRELPFLFASGAATAAGAATVMACPPELAAPARRLAIGGAVAELAVEQAMEKRLGDFIGEPYHEGMPHRLVQVSRATTALGAGLLAWRGRRSRTWATVAGALMNLGASATRWSVYKAGFASADDPKYTVAPQRERIERGETAGAARTRSRVAQPDHHRGSPALNLP
jgi:hypothetical protein